MAKVWFARRRGNQWIAPGGVPAFEGSFSEILFPLDVGTHRRLDARDAPLPAGDLPTEPPERLQWVVVEVGAEDVVDREFSGYYPGHYDSALSPSAAAQRLTRLSHSGG